MTDTNDGAPCPPLPGDEKITEDNISRKESDADYDAEEVPAE